ncbi:MAG: hypothetical protein ABW168_13950 [Sedimenticola sp.]
MYIAFEMYIIIIKTKCLNKQVPGGDVQGRRIESAGASGLPRQEAGASGQSVRSDTTRFSDGDNATNNRHGRVRGRRRRRRRSTEFVCETFYHGIGQKCSAWDVVYQVKYDPSSFTNRCTYYDTMGFKMCLMQLYISPESSLDDEQLVSETFQSFYKYDQVMSQFSKSFYGLETGNSGVLYIHFVANVKVKRTKKIKDYMRRAFRTFEGVTLTIGNFMKVKEFEFIIKYIADRSVIMGANSGDILHLLACIGMY